MEKYEVKDLNFSELENIEGGSLAIAIGVCYGLGFLTGAAIVYFAR